MIPSVVTFVAILGCVLRCACQVQTQTSVNNQRSTIIINHHTRDPMAHGVPVESAVAVSYPPNEVVELHEDIAIHMGDIEMTVQPSVPLQKADLTKSLHEEWLKTLEKI
jgi:hypothetical protein